MAPPSSAFQKDLSTDWIDASSTPSKEFEVKNNATAFLVLFVCQCIWPFGVAFSTDNYGIMGVCGSAFAFLVIYLQTITKVRREGDALVFTQVQGTKVVPLSKIESVHIGYNPKCCDCSLCCTEGGPIKPYSVNLLLTYKNEGGNCCRSKGVVLVVEDVKAFVETLLGTVAAIEAVSAMTLV